MIDLRRLGPSVLLIVGFALAPAARGSSLRVRAVQAPVLVDVRLAEPAAAVDALVGAIDEAAPGRLVALRIVDRPLRFESPPGAAPPAAEAERYERDGAERLGALLAAVRARRAEARLSIAGLPVEPAPEDGDAARRMNRHYAPVIERLDAFVTPRSFIIADGAEQRALRRQLPEAAALSDGRPIFFRANGGWRLALDPAAAARRAHRESGAALDAPAVPPVSDEAPDGHTVQEDATWPPDSEALVELLRADWGLGDSVWDLNDDGTVDASDLLILLADPEAYAHLAGPPAPGQWVDPPETYALGSSLDVAFEVLDPALTEANVVFQTWSSAAEEIQAVYPDGAAPFAYPGAVLDTVTPGHGEIQAILRDEENTVIEVFALELDFVAADPWGDQIVMAPPPPAPPQAGADRPDAPGGGEGEGAGGEGEGEGAGGEGEGEGSGWGDPDAPAPAVVLTVVAAVGPAPFTAHVHALESDLGAGDPLSALYQWDFGDGEGDYNELTGWNAAHTYDEPGTYTVTATITNEQGRQGSATAEIVVTPDTRGPVYVSADGSDANSGATPEEPVRTFGRAIALLHDNTVVLFRRGDVFDVSDFIGINKQDWRMTAYGSGPRPVLRWTGPLGGQGILSLNDGRGRNAVIENIHFSSIYAAHDGRNICTAIYPDGVNTTVRNCRFSHVTDALNCNRFPDGVFSYHNVATGLRAYYLWGQGTDHVHVGNTVDGSMFEHNVRFRGIERILFAHNDLTNQPKRCIWSMEGRFSYLAYNHLHDGRLTVGPDHVGGADDDRFHWSVVEGNIIDKEADAVTPALEVEHGAAHVMIRNNIVRTNANSTVAVKGYSAERDRTSSDVRVFSNTGICSGSGRFLYCGGGAESMKVANNLYIAPEMIAGDNKRAILFILGEDLSNFELISNNCWPIPAGFDWQPDTYHYLWPYWAHPDGSRNREEWAALPGPVGDAYATVELDEQYRPVPGSAAIGHAERVGGVFVDAAGVPRPPLTWTAGAMEAE